MAGTDTPWARLDQTFAFHGSDDDNDGNETANEYDGYDEYGEGGRGSRKGSVATIMIGHEPRPQPQPSQHRKQHRQHGNVDNNTHHRTATPVPASLGINANYLNYLHGSSINNYNSNTGLGYLSTSTSSRSSSRPSDKPFHRSQPSASSVASSVSSFNIQPGGFADADGFTSSSLKRGASLSSHTTLLRPAQSSAGWFSSVAQQRTQDKNASSASSASDRRSIEPLTLTPLDLPPLASPPTHALSATAGNLNTRPITPLAQPPLMAPLALPPLKPRSRGGGSPSFASGHLPAASLRSVAHGDAVSLFSVHSMGSAGTSTAASAHNSATRDDSSSTHSERRVPAATTKQTPSLPLLSSFSSSSRLKPSAAAPGKAVRKFMRMAGKAASSAKDAMKGPLHTNSNGSTPSIGSHSASGAPSITVTTPVESPVISSIPSPRPPQSPPYGETVTAAQPAMVPRRRSMSKISQLTGMDVGDVGSGSTATRSSKLSGLRRSQSDTPVTKHHPQPSSSPVSNLPGSAVTSPTSTTATTPSVWNTAMFNSDDENDDEIEDEHEANDGARRRDSSITSKSPVPTAPDEASVLADTPDPATASLLRSLSQTSSQPPPSVYQPVSRQQPSQQTTPLMVAEQQRSLLPPNRLLKIKRYSDPAMAPIIEHPDDATNPSGSSSSRASSHYSVHEGNSVPDAVDEDASAFIPSRPAPVPVRSPSPSPAASLITSPTPQPMLSLNVFSTGSAVSAGAIAKHIPTIRLFPSSSDNQRSTTSPTSPIATASSPTAPSPSAATAPRKIPLPTSSDISNPWPTSPPPRPAPPPPLHPIENEASEVATDVAEKRLSGAGSTAMFRTVQWVPTTDNSRSSSATPTGNRLSLHARTKSNGSASESIATSIATSVTNSSTSGSSALSSTVTSTIGSSNRSAGYGSFSSTSTSSNRHSYLASPPLPLPPPPNYPLPPLPTPIQPTPASQPSQSSFDYDDDEGGARMMAARMMKKAASRDSVRWRPTALGKSLFRRESTSGPGTGSLSAAAVTSNPASQAPTSQPLTGGGLRSSLSTRNSLSTTTLLAAQRVAHTTRKAVEAVSESSGGGNSSAARQHELEREKWREDLRSRIRLVPEGGEVAAQALNAETIVSPVSSPATASISVPAPTIAAQQPKAEVRTVVYEMRSPPIHDNDNDHGGMI
ncbi:hypothetical protein SPBR_09071 [Sporothrix brasiliensis 5110]|uniref:Uncharacterized protein n=1 Tax=Sporothrix brasiliensis 5110 TaxID=1398154 RepID=A0A0C2FL24_9PEZI|nr:uncharacterized protein SPBR_09071 [Sporothrix brasiliensis 5110]KIH91778.1 hypothetical protein SPBR_09071 [Sporothrix brasiliensis 5110]